MLRRSKIMARKASKRKARDLVLGLELFEKLGKIRRKIRYLCIRLMHWHFSVDPESLSALERSS